MSEYTSWNDSTLPAPVKFAPEALERIRRLALDGLLSLPRVGVGIGGLLLGTRDESGISVLDFRLIECRHAFGPSFRLTVEELSAAAMPPALENGHAVVGCCISKTRGAIELTPEDRMLFDSLCPEKWQIAFLVAPSSFRPTRGAIFARAGKELIGGAESDIADLHRVLEIPADDSADTPATPEPATEPVKPEPPPSPKPEPPAPKPAAKPILVAKPAPVPEPEIDPEPAFLPEREPEPEFMPRRPAFADRPLFAAAVPPPQRAPNRLKWIMIAAALALLALTAFATSAYWMPGPALDLRSSDSNGHLVIEWNRKAVRGIPRALITVNDGAETRTLTIEGSMLHSGTLDYERKSGKVTVRMRAGSADETTTFNSAP